MAPSAPARILALALSASLALGACSVSTSAPEPTGKTAEQRAAEAAEAARQDAAREAAARKFPPLVAGVGPDGRPLVYAPAQAAAQRYDFAAASAAIEEGAEALENGAVAAARQSFEAAIAAWPVSVTAWQGLAETADRQEDTETADRARFFTARIQWAMDVHPLAAAHAFRNLSEGRTGEAGISGPAYRDNAAQLVDFLEAADLANVAAANRAQPGEDFVQRYGIYLAGAVTLGLILANFNEVFFGDNSGDE